MDLVHLDAVERFYCLGGSECLTSLSLSLANSLLLPFFSLS